jgi:hypothetical protein
MPCVNIKNLTQLHNVFDNGVRFTSITLVRLTIRQEIVIPLPLFPVERGWGPGASTVISLQGVQPLSRVFGVCLVNLITRGAVVRYVSNTIEMIPFLKKNNDLWGIEDIGRANQSRK